MPLLSDKQPILLFSSKFTIIIMLRILFISSLIITFNCFKFNKAEISLVMTDVDVTANPAYIAPDYEVFLLDDGIDNQIFINFTVIKLPPETAESHFEILGATMGEYKIRTGFEYTSLLCDVINEPIILGRLVKSMGFTGCPAKLGNYGNEAYEIDLSTLPDEFPPNKYILHVWLDTEDDMIGSFTLYFTIQ